MIEHDNGRMKLLMHRSFDQWHGGLIAKPFNRCMNGSCPWGEHNNEGSFGDPWSAEIIKSLPSGTRMLILTDYCDESHVAYLTLKEVYLPDEYTQLRFKEDSLRCWYFKPNPNNNGYGGHMVHLYSTRYIALVDSDFPSFGKYGGLDCFTRELARVGDLSPRVARKLICDLHAVAPTYPLLLKPWTLHSKTMQRDWCQGDAAAMALEMNRLLTNRHWWAEVAAFLIPFTQAGHLTEIQPLVQEKILAFPAEFSEFLKQHAWFQARQDPILKPVDPYWIDQWNRFFS